MHWALMTTGGRKRSTTLHRRLQPAVTPARQVDGAARRACARKEGPAPLFSLPHASASATAASICLDWALRALVSPSRSATAASSSSSFATNGRRASAAGRRGVMAGRRVGARSGRTHAAAGQHPPARASPGAVVALTLLLQGRQVCVQIREVVLHCGVLGGGHGVELLEGGDLRRRGCSHTRERGPAASAIACMCARMPASTCLSWTAAAESAATTRTLDLPAQCRDDFGGQARDAVLQQRLGLRVRVHDLHRGGALRGDLLDLVGHLGVQRECCGARTSAGSRGWWSSADRRGFHSVVRGVAAMPNEIVIASTKAGITPPLVDLLKVRIVLRKTVAARR